VKYLKVFAVYFACSLYVAAIMLICINKYVEEHHASRSSALRIQRVLSFLCTKQ
jgi:hypothetical protein